MHMLHYRAALFVGIAFAMWADPSHVYARSPTQKSKTKLPVVFLDPGHGGSQTGAHGICGLQEKDLTLKLAKQTAAWINRSGMAKAKLSRTTDLDLDLHTRVVMATQNQARILLSIHANAAPHPGAHGSEVFFAQAHKPQKFVVPKKGKRYRSIPRKTPIFSTQLQALIDRENTNIRATRPIQGMLQSLLGHQNHRKSQRLALAINTQLQGAVLQNRPTKRQGVQQAPFWILRHAPMPAVLAEVGFLTHKEECQALKSPSYQQRIARALASGAIAFLHSDAHSKPIAAPHISPWPKTQSSILTASKTQD